MRIKGEDIIFSSGKRVKRACNRGIIGLSPALDDISEGYDGGICKLSDGERGFEPSYTKKERREICDYMIKLWKEAKKKIKK